ncbi:MAG: glycosyltransferase family 4 protein [Pseudomonadota bacterium]
MKIIYLHQYFNTPDMAGATRSYELARRLVAMGHEVHMVTSDRDGLHATGSDWHVSDEAGINVHWFPVPYSNKMSFLQRTRAFLKFAVAASRKAASLGGDVVFATSTPLTIAVPAMYAIRRNRIPMVFEVRDLWPAVPIALGVLKNPVLKFLALWLENKAYQSSTEIVALAPGMKEEVVKSGYPADKVTVIPNGCDLELFQNREGEVEALRAKNEWLQDRPLVSYIGTLGRVNAVDYLVRVAGHMLELDPEVRFVVIGGGAEAPKIRALAQELNVLDKNFFMFDRMPKAQVVPWFCASSMSIALVTGPRFIWKDATQNKYFDTMAAGRPVAANYDGWQAQLVSDEGGGVILDAKNHEQAARQLLAKLSDEKWMREASEIASNLARTRFSRDSHGQALEEVLARAVSEYA